jgi:hypothetical protein
LALTQTHRSFASALQARGFLRWREDRFET